MGGGRLSVLRAASLCVFPQWSAGTSFPAGDTGMAGMLAGVVETQDQQEREGGRLKALPGMKCETQGLLLRWAALRFPVKIPPVYGVR